MLQAFPLRQLLPRSRPFCYSPRPTFQRKVKANPQPLLSHQSNQPSRLNYPAAPRIYSSLPGPKLVRTLSWCLSRRLSAAIKSTPPKSSPFVKPGSLTVSSPQCSIRTSACNQARRRPSRRSPSRRPQQRPLPVPPKERIPSQRQLQKSNTYRLILRARPFITFLIPHIIITTPTATVGGIHGTRVRPIGILRTGTRAIAIHTLGIRGPRVHLGSRFIGGIVTTTTAPSITRVAKDTQETKIQLASAAASSRFRGAIRVEAARQLAQVLVLQT